MYELNNILLTLLTIGGVGFINYLVTDQLGTTKLYKEAKEVRLGYCLLWSLVDYVIYLMLLQALKLFIPHNWILIVATILTILIAWIGTSFLAYPLQKLVYGFYGWISTNFKNNHSLVIQDGDPWETILDETRSDKTNVYFFTLNHKPISAGRLYAYSSDEISNYQAVVYPFKDVPLESYEKLHERVMNNKFQEEHLTYEYINTKQNFIVVITYPRSKL